MQYLLTDDEMAEIRREREAVRKLPGIGHFQGQSAIALHLSSLKDVCQHIATTMVPATPADQEGLAPSRRPHGCIHVPDPRGPQYRTRYCSGCAVADICPQTKAWSK